MTKHIPPPENRQGDAFFCCAEMIASFIPWGTDHQSVVMNPRSNIDFPSSAPIPHQRAMKLHEDTWIYISEKFGNMEYIEDYNGILRYEKFV